MMVVNPRTYAALESMLKAAYLVTKQNTLPPRFKSFTSFVKNKNVRKNDVSYLYMTDTTHYILSKTFVEEKIQAEKFNKQFKKLIK